MSKQIVLLLDNSGSMFSPVDGNSTNDKIIQTSLGNPDEIVKAVAAITNLGKAK